jgi:hypothetical protein
MNLPPVTYNGNTVFEYGRLFYIVTSNSRKGLIHFVDLEESEEWKARFLCTCEAFKYGERPCRHIKACFMAIATWAKVEEDVMDEWADRLMFLLSMGHSFRQALESPSICSLQPTEAKPAPQRTVRNYVIKANETPRANPQREKRRLPARLHRDVAGSQH